VGTRQLILLFGDESAYRRDRVAQRAPVRSVTFGVSNARRSRDPHRISRSNRTFTQSYVSDEWSGQDLDLLYVPLSRFQDPMCHTRHAPPERTRAVLTALAACTPSVAVTMSIRKLTAGSGYDY
jgi:hypothetical protein